jgi:uncharacterized protein DUF2786
MAPPTPSRRLPDTEQRPAKRQVRQRPPQKLPAPLYKAKVTELAGAKTTGAAASSIGSIDDAVLKRIKKCLQRANHGNTPEAEAKTAFYIASRLMQQHNVTQADILAHESQEVQQQYAGQSVVTISRADGSDAKVNNQGYVSDLSHAMITFFDCKSYSTSTNNGIEWTFYGIVKNTAAAAMAFEMAYNLIAEWARPYKGVGSKNSYCMGISEEFYSIAKAEKRAERRQAEEAEREELLAHVGQEELQRQAEIDRLAPLLNNPPHMEVPTHPDVEGPTSFSSPLLKTEEDDDDYAFDCDHLTSKDDEDDYSDTVEPDFKLEGDSQINLSSDLDDMIKRLVKSQPELDHNLDPTDASPLSSTQALLNDPDESSITVPDQSCTENGNIKQEQDNYGCLKLEIDNAVDNFSCNCS